MVKTLFEEQGTRCQGYQAVLEKLDNTLGRIQRHPQGHEYTIHDRSERTSKTEQTSFTTGEADPDVLWAAVAPSSPPSHISRPSMPGLGIAMRKLPQKLNRASQ